MSTISVSLPSDGQTIDAADVNTPINTIVAAINGNLDDDNVKALAGINGNKLATSTITNTQMATAVKPVTLMNENTFDHFASGCVWTADSAGVTLLGSMTSGVVYINGARLTVAAISNHAFTASKDTYVDFSDNGDGTALVHYSETTNNAASVALTADWVRNAIVVTGASSIAAATSINQGQEDRVLPIASSTPYAVTDSLGNLICPRDPQRKTLGYRQIVTSFTSTTTGSYADVTALSAPIIMPTNGRKINISVGSYYMSTSAVAGTNVELVCTDATAGTVVGGVLVNNYTASGAMNPNFTAPTTPISGSRTYKVQFKTSAAGTFTLAVIATVIAFIRIEQA